MRAMTRRTFDFKVLMETVGVATAQAMADRCGLNRKGVHNRIIRGIGWAEADDLAVRCGYMPWEIWPEWADVDPTTWMKPVCATHGNEFVEDLDDLTQRCWACATPTAMLATQSQIAA
jgi:hypothetical protein